MTRLVIIMYHYVRPIKGSKYPGIKGLELEGFERQLGYLEEKYSIVSGQQVIDAVKNGKNLPHNACWLTFDDGYKDHIRYVLPELLKRNITGSFFPPRVAVNGDRLLDVNAIHYILNCSNNEHSQLEELYSQCMSFGFSRHEIDRYYKTFGHPNRFDDGPTIFVKRMLQHALPEDVRNAITSNMFKKFIGLSEKDFANELYMNIEDVRKLVAHGMYVGSHGSMHYRLDKISKQKQKQDIVSSLEFLEEIKAATTDWIMCFPYGAYDNNSLELLSELGAAIGLTTEVRIANLLNDNPFALPRLDTNDYPQ